MEGEFWVDWPILGLFQEVGVQKRMAELCCNLPPQIESLKVLCVRIRELDLSVSSIVGLVLKKMFICTQAQEYGEIIS